MATSVTLPTIITMPIIDEMFSSVPVHFRPMNTAAVASTLMSMMAIATRKLS